jgi:hypothetical protein
LPLGPQGVTMNEKEIAQHFNEILKAYGVFFNEPEMRSRLIIDLMQSPRTRSEESVPSSIDPDSCTGCGKEENACTCAENAPAKKESQ